VQKYNSKQSETNNQIIRKRDTESRRVGQQNFFTLIINQVMEHKMCKAWE
jgi:hypothetical protein